MKASQTAKSSIALGVIVMAGILVSVGAQAGAIISWSGSSLAGDGTADISTVGILLEAHNAGAATAITAGGVLFDGAESNPLGAAFSGSNPGGMTGDTDFDALLNSASYAFPGSTTYTIDALTTGTDYLIQFFTADSRTCCAARAAELSDNFLNAITSTGMGRGYAFTGTFTAIGTTQDVNFFGDQISTATMTIPLINAWQVRVVPAPATLALFGLGLAGLGWSRCKA